MLAPQTGHFSRISKILLFRVLIQKIVTYDSSQFELTL